MARLDFKRGRFSVDYETNEAMGGLRGLQAGYGDRFDYYRFDRQDSVTDDIYDEAAGTGRAYTYVPDVPALWVVHTEGAREDRETGWYYNDEIHITASFDQLAKIGFERMDLQTASYLKDRIVYDGKVFSVRNVQVLGQIQRRDMVVTIDATQVKPDEMAADFQFARFAHPDENAGMAHDSAGQTTSGAAPAPFIDGGTP